jgi:hypothetical protein
MANLATKDKLYLEKLLQIGGGYVLDFSNRTMEEFFRDNVGINIYDEAYAYASGSKANYIRGFWLVADNALVGKSILELISYIRTKILLDEFKAEDFKDMLISECESIAKHLMSKSEDNPSGETIFDLAFSFAGEDRQYVESVKAECDKLGLSTYYDKERKVEQWGKSFISEQRKVYSGYKTKHFVPFISKHYFSKPIPTDEFKSALLESTKRSRYILPIKLDDSRISVEYLRRDVQYLKSEDHTPKQLALALKQIVDEGAESPKDIDQLLADELDLPMPKIVPRSYSKYEEAESLLDYLAQKFETNLDSLRPEGYVPVVRRKGDDVKVLIEREGRTVFVLNLFFSSLGDSRVGYNFDAASMMANAKSENGSIEPIYDKEQQKAGFLLMDYSNFGDKEAYSKEDIMKFFWKKMAEQIERRSANFN